MSLFLLDQLVKNATPIINFFKKPVPDNLRQNYLLFSTNILFIYFALKFGAIKSTL